MAEENVLANLLRKIVELLTDQAKATSKTHALLEAIEARVLFESRRKDEATTPETAVHP